MELENEATVESMYFSDFLNEDGDGNGSQTETSQEAQESSESGEGTEEVSRSEGAEKNSTECGQEAQEAKEGSDDGDSEQTFTLKVNKEERTVSREEMVELAQKGADYDRVKGQLESARETLQQLQEQADSRKDLYELLELVSEQTGSQPEALVEQLYINLCKAKGSTEGEAKATLKAARLEKQIKQQASNAKRAQTEVAEFRRQFPDVPITEDLVNKLMEDVQSGMTMANAYRKLVTSQQAAQIAELQRQLAAEKQNSKNRASTPGSQQDSGGRQKKDAFDDFLGAFI